MRRFSKRKTHLYTVLAIGFVLLGLQLWQCFHLTTTTRPSSNALEQSFAPQIRPFLFSNIESESDSKQHVASISHNPSLQVDIISVGSLNRPEFVQTQRETFGTHITVRYFISVTEEDDFEQQCSTKLTKEDAKAITEYCRLKTMDIPASKPHYLLLRQRQGYKEWNRYLSTKTNPAGWICAQKRPPDALQRTLQMYTNNISLPDYLMIIDDDTYLDMPAVTKYLATYFHRDEALVMAGCRILFRPRQYDEYFTCPYGGFGTFLSRAALKNLVRPISCTRQEAKVAAFVRNACTRLRRNAFDERRYFREGMSVSDLMHAYVTGSRFIEYRNWSDGSGAFCLHSDWIWGYFFNYYNIGSHTGNPFLVNYTEARLASYRTSDVYPGMGDQENRKRWGSEGQCRFVSDKCTTDSHICHYMVPDQMLNLTSFLRTKFPQQFVDRSQLKPAVDNSAGWKAVWSKMLNTTTVPSLSLHVPPEELLLRRWGQGVGALPVFSYPLSTATADEVPLHFVLDGVNQSSRLSLSVNSNEASVWVIDAERAKWNKNPRCTDFVLFVQQRLAWEKERERLGQPKSDWKIAILYWEDSPLNDFLDCFRVTRLAASDRIHRFKSSVVLGRSWNNITRFAEPGHVVDFGNWREHSGAPVRTIHRCVDSAVVDEIRRRMTVEGLLEDNSEATFENALFSRRRLVDVSYLDLIFDEQTVVEDLPKGNELHDAVSSTLRKSLARNNSTSSRPTATFDDDTQTWKLNISTLLDCKIVVLSQNATREDQRGLMYALVSGALVMSDPILSLPEGLKDGKSLVFYHSLSDLLEKIQYYLLHETERSAIARQGYRVAMTRHRSWHCMERIIDHVISDSPSYSNY